MADPARRSAAGPASPGWGDARQAVIRAAEVCACAAVSLALRGPHGAHAAMMIRQAAEGLRDVSAQLRYLAFDEAVIEAERTRAAGEALAAAGLVPAPRGRHLHVIADDAGAARRTRLTAGERAELARRFAVMDIDGNGVWQRDDYQLLTRRLCEAFGHPAGSAAGHAVAAGQRALFDALLSHMDADGDQEITLDEFTAAAGRPVTDRPGFDTAVRTAARTLLRLADRDGDGELDAGEYARLAAVYGAGPGEAARAFGRLGQDRDGMLDTAGLALAISQFFTSVPRDACGT